MDTAIELALKYGLKYGPTAAKLVVALFKKASPTLDDVDKLFDDLKPYEELGIPDTVPAGSPT